MQTHFLMEKSGHCRVEKNYANINDSTTPVSHKSICKGFCLRHRRKMTCLLLPRPPYVTDVTVTVTWRDHAHYRARCKKSHIHARWGIPRQIEPNFQIFLHDHLRFWWNLVYRVLLGPEHDSDSFTSLRIIVSALLRGKLWIRDAEPWHFWSAPAPAPAPGQHSGSGSGSE